MAMYPKENKTERTGDQRSKNRFSTNGIVLFVFHLKIYRSGQFLIITQAKKNIQHDVNFFYPQ